MKRLITFFLAIVMAFGLCACGGKTDTSEKEATKAAESANATVSTKDALIEEFNEYVKLHMYMGSTMGSKPIDEDRFAAYKEWLGKLEAEGVTSEECPAMDYAKKICELDEYIKYNRSISCATKVSTECITAPQSLSSSIDSASKKDMTTAISHINRAISEYQEGIDIVSNYSRDDYKIAELSDALSDLHKSATLFKAYYEGGSSSELEEAYSLYETSYPVFADTLSELLTLRGEILDIEIEATKIRSELEL
ncbi:MAG: hypothetical protein IJO09_05735 [Oscillospiraceae bacterium]|nr:hypothetical protein [Oscillospiraceae bacterium]